MPIEVYIYQVAIEQEGEISNYYERATTAGIAIEKLLRTRNLQLEAVQSVTNLGKVTY